MSFEAIVTGQQSRSYNQAVSLVNAVKADPSRDPMKEGVGVSNGYVPREGMAAEYIYPTLLLMELPDAPAGYEWVDILNINQTNHMWTLRKVAPATVPATIQPIKETLAMTTQVTFNTAPSTATDAQKWAVFLGNGNLMMAAWTKDGYSFPSKPPPADRMLLEAQQSWNAAGYAGEVPLEHLATVMSALPMWGPAIALQKSLGAITPDKTPPAVTPEPSTQEITSKETTQTTEVTKRDAETTTTSETTQTTQTSQSVTYTLVVEGVTIGTYATEEEVVTAVGANSKIGDRVRITKTDGTQTAVSSFIRTSTGVVDVAPSDEAAVAAMTREQLHEYVVKAETDQAAEQAAKPSGGFPWWILAVGGAAATIL